ncbi:MAG: D-alanyl-D-alanine carboxypeptidase [Clostridia bacterium]|nr:D-alanyl-D-alanine carboxypeptidase [Clostridia bacterium]
MKKALCIIISLCVMLCAAPAVSRADAVDMTKASAALLIDADSGRILLEKDADAPTETAGLVRLPALLTVCKAFDRGDIDDGTPVTVSSAAAAEKGVTAFLAPNERISAGDLLKAAVMLNPGDAIRALLEALYGSESSALDAVNEELNKLGVGSISEGAMGRGHPFTAKELAAVCRELTGCGSFLRYSSVYLDTLYHENASPTQLTNPNRLVRFYSGCFGLATGSVGSSEYAGAFAARRGTTTFIAIVAGMPDSASRFKLASDMLDYGFASFRSVSLGEEGESLGSVPVKGGTAALVEAVTGGRMTALVPVSSAKLTTRTLLPGSLDAPVEKGAVIGTLEILDASSNVICEVPLIAASSIDRAAFADCFRMLLLSWLRIK